MRNIFLLFICVVFCIAEKPFHDLSFDEACKKAGEGKKIVMIDFYTTWCGPCKRLDRTTWKDEKVQELLEKETIALKIDAEEQKDLAKKFKIRAYPTMIFVTANSEEKGRIVGYRTAEKFIAEMQEILAGKDNMTRAKEKFDKGDPNDPINVMDYAKALANDGKHQQALEKYLWCYDNGSESPAFGGVRNSFLLSNIKHLGSSYPKAIAELNKRYEKLKNAVSTNQASKNQARDLCALGRALDKNPDIMHVYDSLASNKTLRASLGKLLIEELLKQKRYKDIASDHGDLLKELDKGISGYKAMVKYTKLKKSDGDLLKRIKEFTMRRTAKFYEVLLGIGEKQQAQEFAQKFLAFDHSKLAYALLIEAAGNAEDKDAMSYLKKLEQK